MPLNRRLLLLATLVALLTARLGFWQLDRAAQKLALQQALDQRVALPALPETQWPSDAAAAVGVEFRRTQASGLWQNRWSVYLDNRPMAGRVGFYLVTPLRLDDGSAVLVLRGWQARDFLDRAHLAPPPPDAGVTVVRGRIAPALSRLYELGPSASGPIRQNLDLSDFARETRLKLKPWVLVQEVDPTSPPDGLLRQWPAPDFGLHKHYGYAFQWFSLCALTIVLYVWFQFIRPRRRGRAHPSP